MSLIPPVTYYLLVKDISTQVGSQRKERKKHTAFVEYFTSPADGVACRGSR